MLRAEVGHYLGEFARVLRPDGVAFVTADLVNAHSIVVMARDPHAVRFPHEHRGSLIQDPERPAAAVAHHEEWLVAEARRVGMGIDRIAYGNWTGRERLAKQDVLLLRRDR